MSVELFPLISFVLITTLTPGPSNVTCASMGVLYGFRRTLGFLAGLTAGFFVIMLLSGLVSAALLRLFPLLEPILRYAGAAYILYLAFSILKASYTFQEDDPDRKPMGFWHGFVLQVSNPKVLIFGFTLFSTFLVPVTSSALPFILALVLLTLIGCFAMTVWVLFGAVIKTYLRSPQAKTVLNIVLALFLVYTAAELAGLGSLF